MAPDTPAEELAGVFARMSGLLLSEQTVDTALALITSLAADTVAGSTGSGITLLSPAGQPTTSAATDPMVERLDALQYDLDQGPCLAAWKDRAVVRSGDLSIERRWPEWSSRAGDLGMCSVLSAALITTEGSLGAIKVYSTLVDAYTAASEDILRRFAAQAVIFVANVKTLEAAKRLSSLLKETLHTRDRIAIARGVLLAQSRTDSQQAFRDLIALSHRDRVPLRQIAEGVIASASSDTI